MNLSIKTILITIFGFIFLSPFFLFAQQNKLIISKAYDNLEWDKFVKKAESSYPVNFYYYSDSIPEITISVSGDSVELITLLINNLKKYNIEVSADDYGNIFLARNIKINTTLSPGIFTKIYDSTAVNKEVAIDKKRSVFLKTNKEYVVNTVVVGKKQNGNNSKEAKITGYIKHSNDSTPVINGTIYIKELGTGTTSNTNGIYSLTLNKGTYTAIVRSINSIEKFYKLIVLSDGNLDFYLEQKLISLDETVISAERFDNVRGDQMGYIKLTTKNIKEIPLVLGEQDIMKVALLMPGIQTVGEGSSGFNVRGSPADQNMFYINNVPVYNTSHLFGFFSSFNSDAIREFTLLKGNLPAQYGGRLSSIINVNTKQGNATKFSARGGISPVTGRILVEGPIKKNRSSFLVGVRSTYSNWLLSLANDPDIFKSKARFSDVVTNLSFEINQKNQIKFFTYYSYDNIDLAGRTRHRYENIGSSLIWGHKFSDIHTMDITLAYTNYRFSEENDELEISAYKHSYELNHYEFKSLYKYNPFYKHIITYGFSSVLYDLNRGTHQPLNSSSGIAEQNLGSEKGIESGLFINENWIISNTFSTNIGLRYNNYIYLGPQTVYEYHQGAPLTINNITDTLSFGSNSMIKSYDGLDYRFSGKAMITKNLSLKLSYNKLHQYIFMLSNTIALSPTDKWKLCDYHIEPMKGKQYSIGLYWNLGANILETSVEAYYKEVENLVEYKDGADLLVNKLPECDVLQGDLNSYGIEFMLKKPYGNINGWLNYSYSRALVHVNGNHPEERTNFGNEYPANYDKPHAFNIVTNFKLSRRFSLSANMVYSTGRPITYPTSVYYLDEIQVLNYSTRNEYRVPDYFRMDLSFKVEGNLLSKKFAHGTWVFSVYNVTGRRNAYSVYFKSEEGVINGYKMSIFGTQIYSLSYNFKLGNYAN